MTTREKGLMHAMLTMLRKELMPQFSDWKAVDDYLFSELDLTKEDLVEIFYGRNDVVYSGSAIEGFAPVALTFDELEPFCYHQIPLLCEEATSLMMGKKLIVRTDETVSRTLFTSGDTPELESVIRNTVGTVWLQFDGNDRIQLYGRHSDGSMHLIKEVCR